MIASWWAGEIPGLSQVAIDAANNDDKDKDTGKSVRVDSRRPPLLSVGQRLAVVCCRDGPLVATRPPSSTCDEDASFPLS